MLLPTPPLPPHPDQDCPTFRYFVIGRWWTALHQYVRWDRQAVRSVTIEAPEAANRPSAEPEPDLIVLQHEQAERIRQAFERCYEQASPDQRGWLDVIQLRLLGGLSYTQIADRLGISEGNARVRFYRGRRWLQRCLDDELRRT